MNIATTTVILLRGFSDMGVQVFIVISVFISLFLAVYMTVIGYRLLKNTPESTKKLFDK